MCRWQRGLPHYRVHPRSCAEWQIFCAVGSVVPHIFGSYVHEVTHFCAGKPIVWHRHEEVPLHAYGALRFRAGKLSSWRRHAGLDR